MARSLGYLVFVVLAASSAATAHHSLTGIYDSAQQVTLEASVVEFHFVNPHPFIVVEVADGTGNAERWRLELDNRFELVGIGVTDETFRPGDRIVASGSRARQSTGLYVRRLDRAEDGFRYEQVGTRPRVTRSR